LRAFVEEFWSQKDPAAQVLDTQYFDFVWKTLAGHPAIRIGTIPEGAVDVVIAPQNSTKRLSTNNDKLPRRESQLNDDATYGEDETRDSSLHPISSASTRKLDDLIAEHGTTLRIAVSSDVVLSSITGTHVRVSLLMGLTSVCGSLMVTQPTKLTPMAYTCLQFISRGREKGITVVKLGIKTGYDQKACFYFVKVLSELNLV
jgi:oxalate---CoA ligase